MSAEAIIASIQNDLEAMQQNRPGSRERIINQAYKLIASLELPSEAIQRMGWAEPTKLAHCQMALDVGLFEVLARARSDGLDVGALASKSEPKVDPTLTSRMAKHLAAMNIIASPSPGRYTATPLSNALTEPRFKDGISYVNSVAGPSFRSMPDYFKSIEYGHPTSLTDGPFQKAHATQLPFFGWLGENPDKLAMFSSYMTAYRAGKPSWSEQGFYPIEQELFSGFSDSTSPFLLVDVGGGKGQDLVELREHHPKLPGRLALQEQPDVVSTIPKETLSRGNFEATAHDFFTTQPIAGARAYYLHSVLHDWSDDDCVRILENLKPAMKRGYSRILINEIVVPDHDANWSVTSMDWLMMALGAMRERTMTDWRKIVERAGLKVRRVYTYELGTESVIDCELL